MTERAWANLLVLALGTVAFVVVEAHLWQVLTPVRDPDDYLRQSGWRFDSDPPKNVWDARIKGWRGTPGASGDGG